MVYSIPKRAGRSAVKPSRKTSASTDKPDKGVKGGSCNRSSCQAPGAVWFNHSTRAYYCPACAADLNRVNRRDAMELYGHDLCSLDPAPR